MHVAKGDRLRALATFQSTTLLFFVVSAATVGFGGLATLTKFGSPPLMLVLVYSGLALFSQLFLVAFRSTGYYAVGTIVFSILLFVENVAVLIAAWNGNGVRDCLTLMIGLRTGSILVLYVLLRSSAPWLPIGVRYATSEELRRLAKPALAAMAIPAALALNLQGMVLVVGAAISPVAAATFAAVRTISRIGIQIVGTLNRASMPEMSAAYATGRADAVNKILLANAACVLFLIIPGAILFALFGGKIVEIWSHGAVRPDASFVALMAVGIVTHSVWYYASNLLMATNSHMNFAPTALANSLLAIGAGIPAALMRGLDGIAAILIITDVICAAGALRLIWAAHTTHPHAAYISGSLK